MIVERLVLQNFRCFGPEPQNINFDAGLTALVGANGAGKTAVMQALLRLFGIVPEQRRLRRQDFHVPVDDPTPPPKTRTLALEAYLSFPELDSEGAASAAIPQFFHQMAADDDGQLKCRLRLEATWTDDGSLEGSIDQKYWAIRTLTPAFEEADCIELKAIDRGRIQMIYVPAMRDGTSQVTAFLRGRLWRAIQWSEKVRDTLNDSGDTLNNAFVAEPGVDVVASAVVKRWQEVYTAGTDTTPIFRPVDLRFQEFVRKVEVVFHPDEAGRDRSLADLSDGQRSLFHLAMTAATLDVETSIADGTVGEGFENGSLALPALTIIAVEEPENNLAPFYLSRIIRQIQELTKGSCAQAMISSHSASILARVDPEQVRHFRLDPATRTAQVRAIRLPANEEEASKFVREAVRTYPELYFARFVVLGEGSSEEVVLPRLAEAMDLPIDRSFVAVVPLGGRHVNHLWHLLNDLAIPHATLLDLDAGRAGGGWGRIKTACAELLANGLDPVTLFGGDLSAEGADATLAAFDERPMERDALKAWTERLRAFGIYYCWPLDLDMAMLKAFPKSYQVVEPGHRGPSEKGDAKTAVFGEDGDPKGYGSWPEDRFRWYRYLFLGRGKPGTHVRVLSTLDDAALKAGAPEELTALIGHVAGVVLEPPPTAANC